MSGQEEVGESTNRGQQVLVAVTSHVKSGRWSGSYIIGKDGSARKN